MFIYGSLLWYIFPVKDGISWEGHLSGFLTGLFLAFMVKAKTPDPKKFAWEQDDFKEEDDPFLRHFDEEGNFIELPEDDRNNADKDYGVNYIYKPVDKNNVRE